MPNKTKFKRSSKACTSCRQMKLKCDAVAQFPKPCSRCLKFSSVCQIDLSFERERRRNAKRVASQMLPESAEGHNTAASSTSGEIDQDINPPPQLPSSSIWPSDVSELIIPSTKILPDQVIADKNLVITGETIRLIFNQFYNHYYPNFPILTRDLLNPEYLLQSGTDFQVLFWSICAVTSPSCCDRETYDSIGNHAQHLLSYNAETLFMSTPFHSLARVLGYLLLCAWPLHHNSLQEDRSWAYCNRAIDIAMRIGLHRSSFTQEYTLRDDSLKGQIAVATFCWAGCFMTNQNLACFSGLPCLTSLNYGIFPKMLNFVSGNAYLTEYTKQVKILHALRQAVEILGNNPDTEFGMTDPGSRRLLHRSIELSFSQLIADMTPLSQMTELYCLCAKLQFHSFLLVPDTAIADRQSMAIPIYLVCIRIIDIVQSMSESDSNFQTWPGFVLRLQVFSAVILFGLMISPFGSLIDVDEARNKISHVYRLLSKVANRANDTATRGMRLIDGLQYMHTNDLIGSNIFTVKSRLGASAFWSLLLVFKRFQLGLQSRKKGQMDPSTVNLVNESLSAKGEPDEKEEYEPDSSMSDLDPDIKSFLEGIDDWELWQPFAEGTGEEFFI